MSLDDEAGFADAESGSVESEVYTAQERISATLERDWLPTGNQLRAATAVHRECHWDAVERVWHSDNGTKQLSAPRSMSAAVGFASVC